MGATSTSDNARFVDMWASAGGSRLTRLRDLGSSSTGLTLTLPSTQGTSSSVLAAMNKPPELSVRDTPLGLMANAGKGAVVSSKRSLNDLPPWGALTGESSTNDVRSGLSSSSPSDRWGLSLGRGGRV